MSVFEGGMTRTVAQRLWFGCIVFALLVHTLVCACMPAHWLHAGYAFTALPATVAADEWVHFAMSDLSHTMSHYAQRTQLPMRATGAIVDTLYESMTGFSALLIMVAVVPPSAQRILALNLTGWLNAHPVPMDASPIHDIPIPPPRYSAGL